MNAEIIENMRYLAQNARTPEVAAEWFRILRDTCTAIITQATIQGGTIDVTPAR